MLVTSGVRRSTMGGMSPNESLRMARMCTVDVDSMSFKTTGWSYRKKTTIQKDSQGVGLTVT